MQFEMVFLLLFAFILPSHSAPREGLPLLNPGGIGGIFEGPDSETIIVGPDGSEITSEQKGGAVIQEDGLAKQPIVVAEPELLPPAPIFTEERLIAAGPIVSSTVAPILTEERLLSVDPIIASTGAPIIASAASVAALAGPALASPSIPLLTGETYVEPDSGYIAEVPVASIEAKPIEIVQQDPHIIETEIIDAPDIEPDLSSDLKGPSGRVITKGSASIISGPASTTITEPRKIIVAPPKIAIGTPIIATATIPVREVSFEAPLPAITAPLPTIAGALPPVAAPLPTIAAELPAVAAPFPSIVASTLAPLPEVSYEVSSTLAPPISSYSTTAAPVEYGYSTVAAPSADATVTEAAESTRIDLGANDFRQSIPVVEYSSSNGFINGPAFLNAGNSATYSSTEAPIISSTITTDNTDKFSPSEGPTIPAAYLVPPAAPQDTTSIEQAPNLESSGTTSNIQTIPRAEDNIAVDGRVDIADPFYEQFNSKTYHLPHVLGMALSRFYRKAPNKAKDTVTIDDKMGELSQNEITSYDTRKQFLPPPNLLEAKYIAPALVRNGVDASRVNLAPVPLSQVTRFPNGAYRRGFNPGYLENRYARFARNRRSY